MALLAAIAILSGAAIALEILLMRLFSIVLWHHFAYMIISVALLGIGASGTFLVFAKDLLTRRFTAAFAGFGVLFAVSAVSCFALAQRVPFNPLEVIWDAWQQVHLVQVQLLLAVPFFAAGAAVGLPRIPKDLSLGVSGMLAMIERRANRSSYKQCPGSLALVGCKASSAVHSRAYGEGQLRQGQDIAGLQALDGRVLPCFGRSGRPGCQIEGLDRVLSLGRAPPLPFSIFRM